MEAAWLVVAYLVAPPILLAAFVDIWAHTGHRRTRESPEVTYNPPGAYLHCIHPQIMGRRAGDLSGLWTVTVHGPSSVALQVCMGEGQKSKVPEDRHTRAMKPKHNLAKPCTS